MATMQVSKKRGGVKSFDLVCEICENSVKNLSGDGSVCSAILIFNYRPIKWIMFRIKGFQVVLFLYKKFFNAILAFNFQINSKFCWLECSKKINGPI